MLLFQQNLKDTILTYTCIINTDQTTHSLHNIHDYHLQTVHCMILHSKYRYVQLACSLKMVNHNFIKYNLCVEILVKDIFTVT